MKCFRCNGRDFDVLRPSLFGLSAVRCSNCSQQFFVGEKLEIAPVELLGSFAEIEKECIIKQCNFCETKRFIAVDATDIDMQSCGFCNYETKPVGEKIPLADFLSRSSSIDGDTQDS
jgi:hypothetical protein